MSKRIVLHKKWFWLACRAAACGWRGQSDKRIHKCPRCGEKKLERAGKASVTVGEFTVDRSSEG